MEFIQWQKNLKQFLKEIKFYLEKNICVNCIMKLENKPKGDIAVLSNALEDDSQN